MGATGKVVVCGVAVLGAVMLLGESRNGDHTSAQPAQVVQSPSGPMDEAARRDAAERLARFREATRPPEAQSAFQRAVDAGSQAFGAAGRDEFLQGAARPARRTAICALGLDRQPVQGWIGQVTTRTTNGDGKGVLGVTLPGGPVVSTWNNGLSDIGDRTLVEPGSPVFLAMGAMQNGDTVRFGGRFARGDADCVREGSLTLRGSMTEPRFIFRFESVEVLRP